MPLIIILPGIIGFYYFGDSLYDSQDLIYPELIKKVLPFWLTGFFVAVVVGAVLSTFNSALNSAATIFSLDLYKQYFDKSVSDVGIVRIGRWVSFILAVFAIGVAPYVASAPDGLYQLLQQLNGIFFIPMATVILAGFLFPKVSAIGAKAGLVFGLLFYIIVNFVVRADIHFVHIWGIEFVLNLVVMHLVSIYYPVKEHFVMTDVGAVALVPWKHTRTVSIVLVVITLFIYILLGGSGIG
jgi:SSS family solute:Na+ symporter